MKPTKMWAVIANDDLRHVVPERIDAAPLVADLIAELDVLVVSVIPVLVTELKDKP